ncbi:MAG: glucose-6-phosphate isomerase family protein [Candidatus Limnocylindria bacterium]
MTPNMDPFTRSVDLLSGAIAVDAVIEDRRAADLHGYFLDDADAEQDRVIYRVYAVPVPEANNELQCSTTVIEPGRIGREYHMTKGHFHAHRDRSEVYLGLAGDGLLILATEDGRHRVEPIRRGTLFYVPGGWAHRSVNTGDEPLVFFSVYVGDAGHDYVAVVERGFPVRVMEGDDGAPMIIEYAEHRG